MKAEMVADAAPSDMASSMHQIPGNPPPGEPLAPAADPALAAVCVAWPALPAHIKAAVLALVQVAKP